MARRTHISGVLTMLLAVAAPAIAAAPLPALVQPATNQHLVGKFVYAELITPDLRTAERFYSGLFGWTFRDVAPAPHTFTEALLDGQQVAGVLQRPMPAGGARSPAWLGFISVSNVQATARAATQNGAKLLYGPRSFPDLGRAAVLRDPQGAVFAVLSSFSGDPADIEAVDGGWIWSSLITSDPQSDAAFYRAVFGYDIYDMSQSGEAKHIILASDSYARASVNPFPASQPGGPPRWLNYIRVEDVAAAAGKVPSLGGRILLPPKVDRDGDMIAIAADPEGAVFGMLQLSNEKSAGEAK